MRIGADITVQKSIQKSDGIIFQNSASVVIFKKSENGLEAEHFNGGGADPVEAAEDML